MLVTNHVLSGALIGHATPTLPVRNTSWVRTVIGRDTALRTWSVKVTISRPPRAFENRIAN